MRFRARCNSKPCELDNSKVYGNGIYQSYSMICAAASNFGAITTYDEFYIIIGEGK